MSLSNQTPHQEKSKQPPKGGRTARARFLDFVRMSTDVFWLLTPTGEMQETQNTLQAFTGHIKSICIEWNWLDTLHPEDQPRFKALLTQSIASGQIADIDCYLRRSDGAYRRLRLRLIPGHAKNGSICEIIVCGTDITRQQLSGQMSEAQVQFAVNASGVGMWDWDILTNQLTWSDQCKLLFGWLLDAQVTYERFLSTIHPDDRERVKRDIEYTLTGYKEYNSECRIIWPDGSIRWLTTRAQTLYDAYNQPMHMLGMVSDITEQRQAEDALRESEVRFRRLVDSNIIGIAVSEPEGTIHEANDVFLSMVGYTREDLVAGQIHWRAMTPPEYQTQAIEAMETMLSQGFFHPFEKEYIRKDGGRVAVLIGGTLFNRSDSSQRLLAFVLDISSRKEIEQQKDLFLGMTSHELKTPLAALKGTLQLVQRRLKRATAAADYLSPGWNTFVQGLAKNLTDCIRQIDGQTRLINDLLDVSRTTAGTLELSLHHYDLRTIVQDTIGDLRAAHPERSLLLEIPEQTPVNVLVDCDRISQVVTNYVTNALRYSSPTQPVHVGLTIQGSVARVWVRDRGPGLTEEAQQELWDRFHQIKGVPVLSGSGKGLGLGLYICQTLIHHHQGEVGVESTLGEGSTFWFTLPIVE